jgi:hypothetical protein
VSAAGEENQGEDEPVETKAALGSQVWWFRPEPQHSGGGGRRIGSSWTAGLHSKTPSKSTREKVSLRRINLEGNMCRKSMQVNSLYSYPYPNQQKPLFLPIIAYALSSTKLEIRAK